jgi:hypothetical protein
MNKGIIRILEYLEPYQPGDRKDISDLLNDIIPSDTPNITSVDLHFIEVLNKYINVNGQISRNPNFRFVGINAFINEEGRISLQKYHESKLQERVHNSAISVNESLEATNEAVKTTNIRMLEHADRQEVIMLQQSGFAQQQVKFTEQQVTLIEQQVTLISTQNNLYKNTLILAGINIVIGLIILWVTINSNADKLSIISLQSQLKEQNKEIKQLQLLKSDTVHYVLHYPQLKSNVKKK